MSRHIIDTGHDHDDHARLREYIRLETHEGQSEAAKALHQAPHAPRSPRKLKEFLRIERGLRS